MDASHFVWQSFLGYLWCLLRIWVKTPSGRQRFNVLGALNAVTYEMLTVCNDSYINAWSVIEMLWKLRKRYLATRVPITIILYNAGYQRCSLVTFTAHLMGIELLFLPPYSPNLNLIERYWKFLKKNCLLSRNYDSFESFALSIETFIETAPIKYADELKTLLTWQFQTFGKVEKKEKRMAA
ncbi:MAG: transposase [Halioglobus sp.]|jgi:transposase